MLYSKKPCALISNVKPDNIFEMLSENFELVFADIKKSSPCGNCACFHLDEKGDMSNISKAELANSENRNQ